eukprot:g8377.t1
MLSRFSLLLSTLCIACSFFSDARAGRLTRKLVTQNQGPTAAQIREGKIRDQSDAIRGQLPPGFAGLNAVATLMVDHDGWTLRQALESHLPNIFCEQVDIKNRVVALVLATIPLHQAKIDATKEVIHGKVQGFAEHEIGSLATQMVGQTVPLRHAFLAQLPGVPEEERAGVAQRLAGHDFTQPLTKEAVFSIRVDQRAVGLTPDEVRDTARWMMANPQGNLEQALTQTLGEGRYRDQDLRGRMVPFILEGQTTAQACHNAKIAHEQERIEGQLADFMAPRFGLHFMSPLDEDHCRTFAEQIVAGHELSDLLKAKLRNGGHCTALGTDLTDAFVDLALNNDGRSLAEKAGELVIPVIKGVLQAKDLGLKDSTLDRLAEAAYHIPGFGADPELIIQHVTGEGNFRNIFQDEHLWTFPDLDEGRMWDVEHEIARQVFGEGQKFQKAKLDLYEQAIAQYLGIKYRNWKKDAPYMGYGEDPNVPGYIESFSSKIAKRLVQGMPADRSVNVAFSEDALLNHVMEELRGMPEIQAKLTCCGEDLVERLAQVMLGTPRSSFVSLLRGVQEETFRTTMNAQGWTERLGPELSEQLIKVLVDQEKDTLPEGDALKGYLTTALGYEGCHGKNLAGEIANDLVDTGHSYFEVREKVISSEWAKTLAPCQLSQFLRDQQSMDPLIQHLCEEERREKRMPDLGAAILAHVNPITFPDLEELEREAVARVDHEVIKHMLDQKIPLLKAFHAVRAKHARAIFASRGVPEELCEKIQDHILKGDVLKDAFYEFVVPWGDTLREVKDAFYEAIKVNTPYEQAKENAYEAYVREILPRYNVKATLTPQLVDCVIKSIDIDEGTPDVEGAITQYLKSHIGLNEDRLVDVMRLFRERNGNLDQARQEEEVRFNFERVKGEHSGFSEKGYEKILHTLIKAKLDGREISEEEALANTTFEPGDCSGLPQPTPEEVQALWNGTSVAGLKFERALKAAQEANFDEAHRKAVSDALKAIPQDERDAYRPRVVRSYGDVLKELYGFGEAASRAASIIIQTDIQAGMPLEAYIKDGLLGNYPVLTDHDELKEQVVARILEASGRPIDDVVKDVWVADQVVKLQQAHPVLLSENMEHRDEICQALAEACYAQPDAPFEEQLLGYLGNEGHNEQTARQIRDALLAEANEENLCQVERRLGYAQVLARYPGLTEEEAQAVHALTQGEDYERALKAHIVSHSGADRRFPKDVDLDVMVERISREDNPLGLDAAYQEAEQILVSNQVKETYSGLKDEDADALATKIRAEAVTPHAALRDYITENSGVDKRFNFEHGDKDWMIEFVKKDNLSLDDAHQRLENVMRLARSVANQGLMDFFPAATEMTKLISQHNGSENPEIEALTDFLSVKFSLHGRKQSHRFVLNYLASRMWKEDVSFDQALTKLESDAIGLADTLKGQRFQIRAPRDCWMGDRTYAFDFQERYLIAEVAFILEKTDPMEAIQEYLIHIKGMDQLYAKRLVAIMLPENFDQRKRFGDAQRLLDGEIEDKYGTIRPDYDGGQPEEHIKKLAQMMVLHDPGLSRFLKDTILPQENRLEGCFVGEDSSRIYEVLANRIANKEEPVAQALGWLREELERRVVSYYGPNSCFELSEEDATDLAKEILFDGQTEFEAFRRSINRQTIPQDALPQERRTMMQKARLLAGIMLDSRCSLVSAQKEQAIRDEKSALRQLVLPDSEKRSLAEKIYAVKTQEEGVPADPANYVLCGFLETAFPDAPRDEGVLGRMREGQPLPQAFGKAATDEAIGKGMLDLFDLLKTHSIGVAGHAVTDEHKEQLVQLLLQREECQGPYDPDVPKDWSSFFKISSDDMGAFYRRANDLTPDAVADQAMTLRFTKETVDIKYQGRLTAQERAYQADRPRNEWGLSKWEKDPRRFDSIHWFNAVMDEQKRAVQGNPLLLNFDYLGKDPYFKDSPIPPSPGLEVYKQTRDRLTDFMRGKPLADFGIVRGAGIRNIDPIIHGVERFFNWGIRVDLSGLQTEQELKRWQGRVYYAAETLLSAENLENDMVLNDFYSARRLLGMVGTQGQQCIDASRTALGVLESILFPEDLAPLARFSNILAQQRSTMLDGIAGDYVTKTGKGSNVQPEHATYLKIALGIPLGLPGHSDRQSYHGLVEFNKEMSFKGLLRGMEVGRSFQDRYHMDGFFELYTPETVVKTFTEMLDSRIKPGPEDEYEVDPHKIYLDEVIGLAKDFKPWCNTTADELSDYEGERGILEYQGNGLGYKKAFVEDFLVETGYLCRSRAP